VVVVAVQQEVEADDLEGRDREAFVRLGLVGLGRGRRLLGVHGPARQQRGQGRAAPSNAGTLARRHAVVARRRARDHQSTP